MQKLHTIFGKKSTRNRQKKYFLKIFKKFCRRTPPAGGGISPPPPRILPLRRFAPIWCRPGSGPSGSTSEQRHELGASYARGGVTLPYFLVRACGWSLRTPFDNTWRSEKNKTKIQKAVTWQHKNATKNCDYTTIADRLRTVSYSVTTVIPMVWLNRFTSAQGCKANGPDNIPNTSLN